jgi:hypothetical protein
MTAAAYSTGTSVAGGFKTGSVNITVPASGSNAANDLMVIMVYKETLSAALTSTNFLKPSDGSSGFDEVPNSNHSLYIGYKRLTTNDSGSYAVNVGGDNSWTEMVCDKITGAITSGSPWDDLDFLASGGNVTAAPIVASTTTGADRLLLYVATNVTGGAWTAASGMTERYDAGGDMTVDTLAQAASGGSGNKSATCAGSGRSISWLGAIKPASSASTVNGTIATTFAFAATAAGKPTVKGTIATTFQFAATAAGKRTTKGAIATTFGFTATAVVPGAPVLGTISTTFGFTATATGHPRTRGTIATTFQFAATAAGKRKTHGTIATTFAFTAVASNVAPPPDVDPDFPWVVRAAPGYDITADPNTMTWVDITSRVRGQIQLRVGKETQGGDSRPCQLTVTLETDDGLLVPTLVTSDWWPYVDEGLPLQFWRCDSDDVPVLRCTVGVDSFNVAWPDGLDDECQVTFVASGELRWMDQGQQVAATASTTTTVAAAPLGSWPLDDADGATSGASALPGGQPMTRTSSSVRFGQVLGPDGVTRYPSVATAGRLYGNVPVTAVTDRWSVQLIAYATSSSTDWWTVAYWTTSSTSAPAWRIRWDGPTSGSTSLRYIDGAGAETAVITVAGNPLGAWHRVAAYCIQSGGNVLCSLYIDGLLAGTGTATGVTTGRVTTIAAGDYDGPGNGMQAVGDVSVWASQVDAATSFTSQTGFDGEQAHIRWLRLFDEAGIRARSDATVSLQMGPQKAGALTDATRAGEDTDGGIAYDEPDGELRYVATSEMYNQAPAITLSARLNGGHLQVPFGATYDDSRSATDVTITREGGGSRRVSVPALRPYPDSDTLSLYTDDLAGAVASWRAHHGAQQVLRYETIFWDAVMVTDNAGNPVLLDATLALRPGMRIVLTDLPRPHPQEDASLILQGWTETHGTGIFRVAAKVGPARLFEIMTIGDNNPANWDDTTARVDSDTSSLVTAVDADDTSLLVASGYGWSTTAVPYDIEIDGERTRVTSVASLVIDAFTRTTSNGWGTATSGQPWSNFTPDSEYAVAGGVATMSLASVGSTRQTMLSGLSLADVDMSAVVSTAVLAAGGYLGAALMVRRAGANDYYFAELRFFPNQSIDVALVRRVGGTETELAACNIGVAHTTSTAYGMRVSVIGSTLKARGWRVSDGEPDSWTISATDTQITAANPVGVRGVLASGNSNSLPVALSVDDVELHMPQVLTVTRAVNDVPKGHDAGAAVKLWRPPVIGL